AQRGLQPRGHLGGRSSGSQVPVTARGQEDGKGNQQPNQEKDPTPTCHDAASRSRFTDARSRGPSSCCRRAATLPLVPSRLERKHCKSGAGASEKTGE